MKKIVLLFLLAFLFCSCTKSTNTEHPYSYYYWRTSFSLDTIETQSLKKATKSQLYTRYFDIDKQNGKFKPLTVIHKKENTICDKEIVPVVFITHRTLKNITKEDLTFLAEKTYRLIQQRTKDCQFTPSEEIQIDYDWTAGTQKEYFDFLRVLKSISNKKITCTLRLHQVKDKEKMGIPPVEKVYLMCYSTSSPLENSERNSILDVGLLENYLHQLEQYPIKNISVALPIYSWGIVTNHMGKHRLINGLNKNDLNRSEFKRINTNEAIVLKDGFYFEKYLNKGFKIKVEEITTQQRHDVIRFIENKINDFDIIYYHLDKKFIIEKH